MRRLSSLACMALLMLACTMNVDDDDVRVQLVPTGVLRVAVPVGPAVSATFATEDPASGELRGPTVALGAALAEQLGVPVEYVRYASSGQITAAGPSGQWDVTFVPVDAARAEVIDFGPAYSLFDSTFLVRAGLAARSIGELDRPGTEVGAVENTTTARAAARALHEAELRTYASVDELRSRIDAGELDAIALSRLSLTSLAAGLPGTHILDEGFHSTATAVAVPRGNAAALAYVTAFVEKAKQSGLARRVLDEAGLGAARVAPAETDRGLVP